MTVLERKNLKKDSSWKENRKNYNSGTEHLKKDSSENEKSEKGQVWKTTI